MYHLNSCPHLAKMNSFSLYNDLTSLLLHQVEQLWWYRYLTIFFHLKHLINTFQNLDLLIS